jgi:hypothetical protein
MNFFEEGIITSAQPDEEDEMVHFEGTVWRVIRQPPYYNSNSPSERQSVKFLCWPAVTASVIRASINAESRRLKTVTSRFFSPSLPLQFFFLKVFTGQGHAETNLD